MIVVDASAAIAALLDDGEARERLSLEPLAAPHLIDAEIAHALRSHVRRNELRATDARRSLGRWAQLGLQRFAINGMLDRVWALRQNLTAYDATYVVVAEALDCPLVTADARLANAPGPRCEVTVVAS